MTAGDKTTLADGYAKLTNPLIEALARTDFSSPEHKCLFCIIRFTYGWNRPRARISGKQWEDTTGMKATNCYRAVRTLIKRNIVIRNGHSYKINPRISQWKRKRVIRTDQWPNRISVSDRTGSQNSDRTGSLPHYRHKDKSKETRTHEGRVQPKGHYCPPCSKCGFQYGRGYDEMDENNVCLDCRQPNPEGFE